MALSEELIEPILQTATRKMRGRQRDIQRFSELELRRRLALSEERVEELYLQSLPLHRAALSNLLKTHAQVLDDGRIAVEPAALQQLIDEAHRRSSYALRESMLEVMFGTDDDGQKQDVGNG